MKTGIISIRLTLTVLCLFYIHAAAAAGRANPSIEVDVYSPAKACKGTTILADNHNRGKPRIADLNVEGEIT